MKNTKVNENISFFKGVFGILTNVNFLLLIVVNILSSIAFTMINTPVSLLGNNLGMSATIIGFVASMYSLSKIFVRPLCGNLFDKRDIKKVYMAILALRALVAVSYAMTSSVPMYVFSRLLQGINFGASNLATQVVVAAVVDKKTIGSAFGLSSLLPKLVSAYTTIVAIFFYTNYGSSVAFFSSAIFSVIAMLALLLVKFPKKEIPVSPEAKNENAIKEKKTINDYFYKPAVPLAIIQCLMIIPTFALEIVVLLYCKEINVAFGGEFLAMYTGLMGIGFFIGGLLGDRFSEKPVVYISLLMAIATFPMVCFSTDKTIWMIAAVFMGLYNSLPSPAIRAKLVKMAGPSFMAVTLATIAIFQDVASTVSTTIIGLLSDSFGYNKAILSLTIFPVVGLIMYFIYNLKTKSEEK